MTFKVRRYTMEERLKLSLYPHQPLIGETFMYCMSKGALEYANYMYQISFWQIWVVQKLWREVE